MQLPSSVIIQNVISQDLSFVMIEIAYVKKVIKNALIIIK